MAQLIRGLDPDVIRANAERIRAEVGEGVELLAAVKYVADDEMPVLEAAGIALVGENRQQQLSDRAPEHPALTFDFIGHLQSRKVKDVLPHVRLIHSVASDSVLTQLGTHAPEGTEVLVEVNVAGEEGKDGVLPGQLDPFLDSVPSNVTVSGLMTMPPFTDNPEDSRRWFAALKEMAADRGLERLSMGTSQDYSIAAQEGATIVRIGTTLYR